MKIVYCFATAFVVILLMFLTGCAGMSGPRVVFVPSTDAPVRAGPNVYGQVYVWNGTTWELSRNKVKITEGDYIWDSGDPAPTNAPNTH